MVLKECEFERWVRASHELFEIFEGRYSAYPLARKWVQEWLHSDKFTVSKEDLEIIDSLILNFNYNVFRNVRDEIEKDDHKWKALVSEIDQQFKRLKENNLTPGTHTNVGFAVAPYLFTWNFQRFKEYFKAKKEGFNLESYFNSLGEFLRIKKEELRVFKDKKLVFDELDQVAVKRIFKEINNKLKEIGIGNDEPTGTVKLLHIFAPYYFPLIDNAIARSVGLLSKEKRLSSNSYLEWMCRLKRWLGNYSKETIAKLEEDYGSSILKLVDEGLYMMSTVKQQIRVAKLGI